MDVGSKPLLAVLSGSKEKRAFELPKVQVQCIWPKEPGTESQWFKTGFRFGD